MVHGPRVELGSLVLQTSAMSPDLLTARFHYGVVKRLAELFKIGHDVPKTDSEGSRDIRRDLLLGSVMDVAVEIILCY